MDLFIKELYMKDSKLYNTNRRTWVGGNCVSVTWLE